MTRPLLLFGPTASGKSALALALATREPALIINADSMQAYRDLRILTARPHPEEEAAAPHTLYGCVDAAERHNVGRWRADALAAIAQAQHDGRRPILVGGTGLYFSSLIDGLVDTPPIPEEIRAALAAELALVGAPALHARLSTFDPLTAARLQPNDAPRILRALEVLEATGEPLSALQAQTQPALAPRSFDAVALAPDRARLYARIAARFATMLEAGALEEVRRLAARGLACDLPAMKAHGVPWLMAHLRGEIDLQEAAALAVRDTRRYAKRQFTWMAGRMAGWPRLDMEDGAARVAELERILRESGS